MLPVVGLVLSVISLCVPGLQVVSFALGLYSFRRAKKDPEWAVRKQISEMTMAVSAAGLLVHLAVILPTLKRRQAYLAKMECHGALSTLHVAQQRFYEKNKRYTTKLSELEGPLPSGRFVLRLAAEGTLEEVGQRVDEMRFPKFSSAAIDEGVPQILRREVGVKGDCPACSVTMLCATNLDEDPTIDVWTVSSIERTAADGSKIAGGIPWCELDDTAK